MDTFPGNKLPANFLKSLRDLEKIQEWIKNYVSR